MKVYLLALLLLLGTSQNPSVAEGTIEGRVLRAGTGDPVVNTPVTLISSPGLSDAALSALLEQISQLVTIGLQGGGGGGSQDITIRQVTSTLQSAGPGVGAQASVLTDRAGRFSFSNVPPGRYTVWVQRFNYYGPLQNGYPSSTSSVTITLDPAKPPAPVDLFMTQGVAISGRVLDPRGQPPLGLAITAYRATYSDGRLVWSPVLSRPIDDRGEYRLAPLAPGDYYVGVTPPQVVIAPGGPSPAVRTFFPGVTEPSQATKLVLKSSDTPSVDFTLRAAPATFFKISGVAVNPVAVPGPTGVVDSAFSAFTLVPLESNLVDSFSANQFPNMVPTPDRTAGEFEIRNVRPGLYELYPLVPFAGFLSGRTIVDVRNTDVAGLRVFVSPMVTVRGNVVVMPASPQGSVRLDLIRVALKPLNSPPARGSSPPAMPVSDSGQFTVTGPAGALAAVQVNGIPESAFVSDIRVGNTSIFETGVELSSESALLQIVIDAAMGGTVETTVQMPDGRPATRATVVLVPTLEDRRRNPMRYKIGTADNNGRVTLRGVAPGSYTAYAWESVPETAWLNKEFLSNYRDWETAVAVAPGAQMNLQLKWIPFDADRR